MLFDIGSRDDRPGKRIRPAPADDHPWRVAIPSKLFPPRSSADDRRARKARLAPQLAPSHQPQARGPVEAIGGVSENSGASWHLLQLIAGNPSMFSRARFDSEPVRRRNQYQHFNTGL